MTNSDGLAVVLRVVNDDLAADRDQAEQLVVDSRSQLDELDSLKDRAEQLLRDTGTPHPGPPVQPPRPPRLVDVSRSTPRGRTTWDEMERDAKRRLAERGVDTSQIALDELLEPDEVAAIERRFEGGFELHADLDRSDVVAAIGAGLVGALVDFLLVRIPKDTLARTNGLRDSFFDRGSPLTKWMQGKSLPHENPLSDICKVSFDRVNLKDTAQELAGSGGRTHRYHTVGHDPLLGLVFGTLDILRGSLTGIDRDGMLVIIPKAGEAHGNPLVALALEVLHLVSDLATKMGIPAPGWTATGLLQFGSIGRDHLTVAQTARQMYIAGYDSRHFLTMASSPAAIEVALRGYWGLRRTLDPDYRSETDHAGLVASPEWKTATHPRFQAMSLTAHSIAAAANAGKIALWSSPAFVDT